MDYAVEDPAAIYQDTVSTGGGAMPYPQNSYLRNESAPFISESSLVVEIPSAVSEKEKVVFSVHTKTTLDEFNDNECTVERVHEEFVWLYEYIGSCDTYAGFILPPIPLRPDFDTLRNKLQQLGSDEGTVPQKDIQKLKAELESKYLASFKKTVAMHELFLQRLAAHPTLRHDHNFRVFLEHKGDLLVRTKSRKEKAVSIIRSMSKTADELLRVAKQRDEDNFFQEEKDTLSTYFGAVNDAIVSGSAVHQQRKSRTEHMLRIGFALDGLMPKECLGTLEDKLTMILEKFFEAYEKLQFRLTADEDLKFLDPLRYYACDADAAKDLLYRRLRALADYEAANRALDKARVKVRDIQAAEDAQFAANDRFKRISESARLELKDFKVRRIKYFQKNLVDLAELEAKHAKSHVELVRSTLRQLHDINLQTVTTTDLKQKRQGQYQQQHQESISLTSALPESASIPLASTF